MNDGTGTAMRFAERMSLIRASRIRELFDEGRKSPDAIDLSIGQAHFDVPDPIKRATIRAVQDERLVAALQLRPAEIGRREVSVLQTGPGGPVEHEDALREQIADFRLLPPGWRRSVVVHCGISGFCRSSIHTLNVPRFVPVRRPSTALPLPRRLARC